MPLTELKVKALKPSDKQQKVSDSDGLQLLVTPAGSKRWVYAYRFTGKQKTLAIGLYPKVSLADARRARDKAREMLDSGQDPSAAKQEAWQAAKIAASDTFAAIAEDWFTRNKARWVPKYADRIKSRMDDDIIPQIGALSIAEITPVQVLTALRKVEARGAIEMAKRIHQMVSQVFRYGVAIGVCTSDPSRDIRSALMPNAATKHRTALPAIELPKFIRQLEAYQGEPVTIAALKLIQHTFVRTSEARFATWDEFDDLDGEAPLWRIPAERMKMRRPHLIPLTPAVVKLLKELRPISGENLLFPSQLVKHALKEAPISENTLIYAMYKLGYHSKATVHGFRRTASTILNEENWNADWIEMQLAHSKGDVRSVYNAAQYLEGRRKMMAWWSEYLEKKECTRT